MSAVFSAALQASRVGLSNRSVLAIVRVSFALSLAAKQPLRSFTVPAIRSRTVPPSILNTQHAKIFHTATAVLSEQTPPSASEVGVKAERGSVSDSSSPTHAELNAIFGQEVDRDGAAELLSRLQRQRRDGTLDQGLPYPKQLIDRGIEYLRAKYPVDEDAAIIARVDRELDGDWHMPQRNPKKSRTGQSGLEEIRRINQAKRDAEEEAQKAKRKEKESQRPQKRGALVTRNKRQSRSLMTEENSSKGQSLVVPEDYQRRIEQVDAWVRKSNQRVAQLRAAATMQRIPQMTKWQRLWRCGLFTLGTIGLALTFAHLYTPPSQKARLLPNIPPAAAVVGTLVAVNILVFLLWRVPYAWRPLNRYFLISTAVPRAFSLLGAEFSHQAFIHLMSNIIALWFLGTQRRFSTFNALPDVSLTAIVHDDIGRGPFLALVACGSVIPSFCSLVPLVMKRVLITSILGGSGIVTTLIATSCVLHEG